ncbi:hypothetical protein B0J12DRAFT_690969 [Macrophomina phaseolina]|uniref:Protein kinase domain-containing protein n=1 Tax=Macrophomina phaseolina TaxID=35725 RepID=A0ABQ8FQB8_9PEZI|nr:hypothetical protein B0J12DRAFT_690969 [Macrophomina phaseolina]
MADELEQLRRQLREEQRRREEAEARVAVEERRREEEQRLREEEQRLRQEAEAITRWTNLIEYLEACHKMSLSIKITDDQTLTTQGDVTKPAGRLYPQRIIPWDAFPSDQEDIWAKLSTSPAFASNRVFPSIHQLDHVRSQLDPIDSEDQLRHFARSAVEKPVQKFVEEVYKDDDLRVSLGLQGTVTFESHTNLGRSDGTTVDEAMRDMSISDTSAQTDVSGGRNKRRGKERATSVQAAPSRPREQRKGKGGGRADQFCIYRQEDGPSIPAVAIEYKAPHKLTREEIAVGLSGDIKPHQDVIDKEGDSPEFFSKWLLAAVVTQCFSYMINRGIQYGYVFTGDAIVFLHIPDDPTTVYYYLSVPNVDVQDDDESRLHRTAVAQVSTFVLRALAAEPPPQEWHQAASALDRWAVEYTDVLKKIPETERKTTRETFSYQPSRWIPSVRSRIRTRSQCLPIDDRARVQRNNDGDSGDGDDSGNSMPPTPTPQRTARSRSCQSSSRQQGKRGITADRSTNQAGMRAAKSTTKPRVEDRPYCTHDCLLGLMRGGPLDQHCPNIQSHKKRHIKPETFLRLVRRQLATDISVDADCKPLYLRGSRGALFKVRLSSHGYTLVAKGMEECDAHHLQHEDRMYKHVSLVQGKIVPVCVGLADLKIPYYYDCGVYTHMLFLSWAGRPLSRSINQDNKCAFLQEARVMLEGLHRLGVLHKDPALRNILRDDCTGRLMWTDLERAEVCARSPLGPICPNRKRKRPVCKKTNCAEDAFSSEMRQLSAHMARSVY